MWQHIRVLFYIRVVRHLPLVEFLCVRDVCPCLLRHMPFIFPVP